MRTRSLARHVRTFFPLTLATFFISCGGGSPARDPQTFGYANISFLREYECDYGGANCHIDLAGYERDIRDHHSLFRLDLTRRDEKFAGHRKSE
jgi:hypothetical protein